MREAQQAPAQCALNDGDGCEGCTRQPSFICSESVRLEKAEIAAQARKEVLDKIIESVVDSPLPDDGVESMRRIGDIVVSFRSQPEKQNDEPKYRTYETCHKHFSCPDGEECWYQSQDYYWDCGKGAARVFEASQRAAAQAREDVLREIDMRIEAGISALHEQGVDGSLPIVVHEKLEVLAWVRQIVEFLRHGQER